MKQNHPLGISLGGIILQGRRPANIIRALSVSCLLNIIDYYEANHFKDDLAKDKLLRMKQDSDAPQGPNS